MFCGKCGNPIPDDQEFCPYCNPISQAPSASAPDYQQAGTNPDVWGEYNGSAPLEQPSFELNTPVKGRKAKQQKRQGGKGGLITVALVLVAFVALTVIFWGNISRFFQRNFGDPAAYLQDVEEENAVALADDIAVAYDQAMASYTMENPAASYTVTLELGDTLMALVQTALAQEGIDVDLSFVDNIVLTPETAIYEDTIRTDIGVGLNNVTVATVSMIWDVPGNMLYIGIPELHDTYVSMDITEFMGQEVYSMEEALFASRELMRTFAEAMPESEQLKELIVKYLGIVFEGISEAEKEKQTVEVGSLEQNLLVVTANLSQKDILKICRNVLKEAKNDEVIEDILDNFQDVLEDTYYFDYDLSDSFSEGVEYALEELDYMMDDAETRTFLTIETYLDSKDTVVGRTFTVKYEGEKVSAYYITVTEDDEWAFEAELGEVFITGEGTIDGDTRSGSYTLSAAGTDYITLAVENYACADNQITGTFRLIPESIVYDSMGISGPYASLIEQAVLVLTLTNDSVTIGIETAGTQFLALTVSGETYEAKRITLPPSVNVNDNEGGMQWASELNFDAVLSNLSKAGIPSQYLDAAEELVEMFRAEFN